jgi:hypothetical protein
VVDSELFNQDLDHTSQVFRIIPLKPGQLLVGKLKLRLDGIFLSLAVDTKFLQSSVPLVFHVFSMTIIRQSVLQYKFSHFTGNLYQVLALCRYRPHHQDLGPGEQEHGRGTQARGNLFRFVFYL